MRLCLAAAYCMPCPPHLGFSNLTVHSAQGEIKKDPALGPFLGRAPFGGGTGGGVRSWSTEEGREHSVSLQFCIRTMGSFGWWSGESRLKYKVLSCRGSAAPSLLHLRSGSGTRSLSNGRREISGCGSQGLLKGPRRDWHCLILWKLLASPSLP